MRYDRLLLLFLLLLPYYCMAQEQSHIVALDIINRRINMNDTNGVRTSLNKLEKDCRNSSNWQEREAFYAIRGKLNRMNMRNMEQSISDYHNAFDAFPSTVAPSQNYLSTAYDLCDVCNIGKQYALGEEVATKALVRASYVADSCISSSGLFSYLAKFYEARGDTIMPERFHRKAQELGIKYWLMQSKPDSVEEYNERLKTVYSSMDHMKNYFDHDHPMYLTYLTAYYTNFLSQSRILVESIPFAEKIIKLAKDYDLADSHSYYETYANLIYDYAFHGQKEEAINLLPKAERYYALFPDDYIDKSVVLYNLALGLLHNGSYNKDAEQYFLQAKEELSDEKKNIFLPLIEEGLEVCRKRK